MKRLSTVIALMLLAIFFALPANAQGQRIAFVRWEKELTRIWTADADAKNAAKLTAGFAPDISPDGSRVAFTYSDKTGGRFIAICDIATKKYSVLRAIPGNNSYGPRWSPDGKRLLFNHFTEDSKWTTGVYDTTKKRCKIFNLPKNSDGVYSPFWSHDGQSIFAHDFNRVYTFDAANGRTTAEMPMTDIIDRASILISSATKFECSKDGASWLICEEDGNEKCAACSAMGGFGMKGTIYIYNLAKKSTTRLSLKELCASSASWCNDDILFTAHRTNAKPEKRMVKSDLYKMSQGAKSPSLIIEDASCVSVSAK